MWSKCLVLAVGAVLALPAAPPQKASKKPSGSKSAAPGAAAAKKSALDKAHLESYFRHLYFWGPQIQVEVGDFSPSPIPGLLQTTVKASYGQLADQQTFYVSKDGKYIITGTMYDAADNPFRADMNKITTALQPSFGAAAAPVVIAVFSDFQCPHCRNEAKVLRENLVKAYPKEVRVFFKDYPLANHDWARPAAIAGRCIFRQNAEAFWAYHDWVFDKQAEINAANFRQKLNEFIKGREIDALQLNQCFEKRETEPEIEKSIAEARSLRVNSTPTLFINGRRLGAIPWETLKQYIDREIEYQKTAQAEAEKCCEVSLPSIFPSSGNK
jgi:protein-disulfide isomerase